MKRNFKIGIILFLAGAVVVALSFMLGNEVKWWLRIGGVILAALAVIVIMRRERAPEAVNEEYRYKAKDSLMTEPEQELYDMLIRLCSRAYCVFPQIALASVVDKVTYASYRNELFRVVDFVLCEKRNMRPVLVIELNDASHKRDERRLRDEKVRCILSRAGLPLLTLSFDEAFDERTLKKKLNALL